MYAAVEHGPVLCSDSNILCLSWKGRVPKSEKEKPVCRRRYYEEGWLATGNGRGVVGVTFTSSHCRRDRNTPQRINFNLRGHNSEVSWGFVSLWSFLLVGLSPDSGDSEPTLLQFPKICCRVSLFIPWVCLLCSRGKCWGGQGSRGLCPSPSLSVLSGTPCSPFPPAGPPGWGVGLDDPNQPVILWAFVVTLCAQQSVPAPCQTETVVVQLSSPLTGSICLALGMVSHLACSSCTLWYMNNGTSWTRVVVFHISCVYFITLFCVPCTHTYRSRGFWNRLLSVKFIQPCLLNMRVRHWV